MNMNINGELIRKLRTGKGWSQDHLATTSGVSLRTVQRIEKSSSGALESKMAIASALEVSPETLSCEDESAAFSHNDTADLCFRIDNGTRLSEIIGGAYGYRLNHDDPTTKQESELLSWAAQTIKDWGEIWSDLDAGDRVSASYDLTELIKELDSAKIWIFGSRTFEEYNGFGNDKWPIANIYLLHQDNSQIINLTTS